METRRPRGSRHRTWHRPVPDWATSTPIYRPRKPTTTPLYPVVQHHLATFLAQATQADPMGFGQPVGPHAWVERSLRAYLRCGILAHGFARAKCADCGHERLVPFSCKALGVCPSCNTRRMAGVAAHIADHVLPHLPVRHWVLSVPKRLRPFLHRDPEIASAVLRIFVRAIRTTVAAVRWKILAFLTDPPVVSGTLLHLNLHHLPPPLSPARGPPQGDFLSDQTSAFDLTEPEPVPDFAFDQSAPDDLDD